MVRVILASGSPRRREICESAGIEVEVIVSSFDEALPNDTFSYAKIEGLARGKAMEVYERIGEGVVIGADTVVVLDGKILGKPESRDEAMAMLERLSGRRHNVVTSLCLIDSTGVLLSSKTSEVEFRELNKEERGYYVDNFNPYDKAGGYGIQELPEGYAKVVEGSVENVIGLCSIALKDMLGSITTLKIRMAKPPAQI